MENRGEVQMSKYELILFDLDGTLTDPSVGITNSVAYALDKFGISVEDRRELYKFIGPPLIEAFMEYCGFSEDKARQALGFYREYFTDKGILENSVYAGIEELLKTLNKAGKRLCVATSKPEPFARRILEHFRLAQYFEFIAGATLDETRTKKDEVIEYALEKCGFKDRAKAVMVGDRKHDILGASKCALDSIGVLFGFGSRQELEAAGADYIARTVPDMGEIILNADVSFTHSKKP